MPGIGSNCYLRSIKPGLQCFYCEGHDCGLLGFDICSVIFFIGVYVTSLV